MNKQEILGSANFGERIAEEEVDDLATYFVETDDWSRLFQGRVDVVYGPKGAGKSALYSLLSAKAGELFDANTILIQAEKPRGTPAFKDLQADPPASEIEFVSLWKLYFLTLLASMFDDYRLVGEDVDAIRAQLQDANLVPKGLSLQGLIQSAFSYVKLALRPQSIETAINLDPNSGAPASFVPKIVFREPSPEERSKGIESVDRLIAKANAALIQNGNIDVWILLDRLDVAFAENLALEANALRALFRAYLDLFDQPNIKLKIFLRSDIWDRITSEGFREASHITRHLTISWNRQSLLNLIVRRALKNEGIRKAYGVSAAEVLTSIQAQEAFFYRLFPKQVDVGPNKPHTLEWLLSRTRDGTQVNAPRELIHMLNSLRGQQMRRFEVGETEPEEENLFSRVTFKAALPEVSEVRLTQTLYSEHPALKPKIEALRNGRTTQTVGSLQRAWGANEAETRQAADELVAIGFFERRGTREEPEYWVPFLYRDALSLAQGTAEQEV
jgi:hypothetical protein